MSIASRYTVALHILTWVALVTEGKEIYVSSDRIANSVNTNPVFIRRILSKLNKNKLVKVQHGGTGAGWRLTRDSRNITLLDVYEAIMDKPLFELHHSSPNDSCVIGKGIQPALIHVYDQTEVAMKQQLANFTIEDLLHDSVSNTGWKMEDVRKQLNQK